LLIEQGLAVTVDGYAAEVLVDRGDEADDLILLLAAKDFECPCAVFAATPA
jgi:hypothetical protein